MRLGRLWSHLGDEHPAEARVLADSKLLPEAYIKEVISVNKETIEEEKVVAGDEQEPRANISVFNPSSCPSILTPTDPHFAF